jgi:lipopolysaccharide export system permease protein
LLVIAAMTLAVSPWAAQQAQDMKDRFEKRGDLDRVTPGQFQESAGGKRVFFIDKTSAGVDSGNNIFIAANERGKEAVTSAQSGRIESLDLGRYLVLNNGQRLETSATDQTFKVSDFERYGTQVSNESATQPLMTPVATRKTRDLLKDRNPINLGQLFWRIGMIVAAINFVILALVAATSNPRAGRSGNMLFAAFAFFLVFQLLNLGQSWIAAGKASFAAASMVLHGGTFLLATLWLIKLHYNWSWRFLLPSAKPEMNRVEPT